MCKAGGLRRCTCSLAAPTHRLCDYHNDFVRAHFFNAMMYGDPFVRLSWDRPYQQAIPPQSLDPDPFSRWTIKPRDLA
jgi:hypothetical protein